MSFHFFSAKKSRVALQKNQLSQKDELLYWGVGGLLGLLNSYWNSYVGLELAWFLLLEMIILCTVIVLGLKEAYAANGGIDGKDFLLRVAVIGTPLWFCTFLVSIILWHVYWYAFPYFNNLGLFYQPKNAWRLLIYTINVGTAVWFWWRLHHHLTLLNLSHKQTD